MKTKDELNALKEEVENVGKKLAELSEEELEQVTGGSEASTASSITDVEVEAIEKMARGTQAKDEKWLNDRRA